MPLLCFCVLPLLVVQGNTQGVFQVTVSGAIQAPFFFKGVHTQDDWLTLRNAPAPFAELGSDK